MKNDLNSSDEAGVKSAAACLRPAMHHQAARSLISSIENWPRNDLSSSVRRWV